MNRPLRHLSIGVPWHDIGWALARPDESDRYVAAERRARADLDDLARRGTIRFPGADGPAGLTGLPFP